MKSDGRREMPATGERRKRLTHPPVILGDDAPLRSLDPSDVKRLDGEAVWRSDERKARPSARVSHDS